MLDCEKIYAKYSDKVRAYIRSHVSDSEAVADLHSKKKKKIVEYAPSYRGKSDAVSSFVYTITRSTVIDFYRGRKQSDDVDFDTIEAASGVEDEFFSQYALEGLARALEKLSAEERHIIELLYWQNKSLKTAAEIMRISYGVAKLRHRSALKSLKSFMKSIC